LGPSQQASSPEDALRIKATELTMATPSNPKDQLAAITEAMKDWTGGLDRKG